MATYSVLIPMAGHICVEVEADSEEAAIEAAFESDDLTLKNVTEWEVLKQFNRGNVCYCPSPWDAEAELIEGDES